MGIRAFVHAAFHERQTRIYRVVQSVVGALILLSIGMLVAEALLPPDSLARDLLRRADRVVLAIFAVEIFLRIASYRPPSLKVFATPPLGRVREHVLARLRYAVSPLVLVDMLAVLALFPELRGLRALRLLRLLRTIRVFRYRNPFAIVIQTLEENALLFVFAFGVLGAGVLLAGLSLYLVEVRINPGIQTVWDGLWWAMVTLTTVGFGDISPVTPLGRIIGALAMVAGMFTLALFAGIVGSSLVTGMLSIREEQFRMSDYANHVVVSGYDDSTRLLVDALRRDIDLSEKRVVLCDDHERPRDLPPDFMWVRGDLTKESELDKVRVTHAAAVIVTGARDVSPQVADARTILTTFTIRSYLGRKQEQIATRRSPVYIVAEILDSENVDHARTAGADEVIETRRIGYSMIAHAVGYHGTATTMSHLLIAGAHNVYVGKIPGEPPEPMRFGALLEQMRLSKRGGLVVGVRLPDGSEVINPPKDRMLEPGTRLIYLAEQALLEPPD